MPKRFGEFPSNTVIGTNQVIVPNAGGGFDVVDLASGSGDMLKSTYDTTNNGIVDNSEKLNNQSPSYYLNTDNHTDGTINKVFTATEKTKLAGVTGTNTGDETNATIKTKLGVATTSTDGYLSSTDWNTFNGKQPAGTYSTDIHSNITALNAVTGVNSGDQDLTTLIDDVIVQNTKTFSSTKIQDLHNAQATAIQNLSGASATFHNSTAVTIPETPTAFLNLVWTNDIASSNTAIFELGTNEITFKKDGNYNFLNSMIFSRVGSGAIVNITFELYDADTSVVLLSAVLPLDIPAGTSEVVPLNVLLPITGTTTIDPVRMKVRMQATSVAGTVLMDSFSTILFAQSVVNIADIDTVPTDGSVNAVQSNGVFDALVLKQNTLVSGTTIKTINGTSVLGSGDIVISGGGSNPIYRTFIGGEIFTGLVGRYVSKGTQTITGVKIGTSTLPVGSNIEVQVYKNGTSSTNSIFTSDIPISITTTESATNGIYTATKTTIDNGSLVENDILYISITLVGSTISGTNLEVIIF